MGIFGDMPNFEKRFIPDYKKLAAIVELARQSGQKIVLTSGSFDLIHEGHALYLQAARALGDLLVVGVDSDEKLRERKGPDRPVVPEMERLNMLVHLRAVDIVTLKTPEHEHWELLRVVRPDILVISKSTKDHDAQEVEGMKRLCGEVVEMEPQAVAGTSARIRLLHVNGAKQLSQLLNERLPGFVEGILHELQSGGKGKSS